MFEVWQSIRALYRKGHTRLAAKIETSVEIHLVSDRCKLKLPLWQLVGNPIRLLIFQYGERPCGERAPREATLINKHLLTALFTLLIGPITTWCSQTHTISLHKLHGSTWLSFLHTNWIHVTYIHNYFGAPYLPQKCNCLLLHPASFRCWGCRNESL